jgi:hypothetical protein
VGYIVGLLSCHYGGIFDEFRRWGSLVDVYQVISLFVMGETWSIIQGRFRSKLSATFEGVWGIVEGRIKINIGI